MASIPEGSRAGSQDQVAGNVAGQIPSKREGYRCARPDTTRTARAHPQIADLLLQALDGHGTERNISAMMGMTIIIGMVTGIAIFYSRNSTWERGRMSGR